MLAHITVADGEYELLPRTSPNPTSAQDFSPERPVSRFARISGVLGIWIRSSWTETVDDLKSIRWRSNGGMIVCHVVAIGLIVSVCMAMMKTLWTMEAIPYQMYGASCQPGGSFRSQGGSYNFLAASEAFVINIGFGSYDFSKVKLIDITWDVLVGRGGQGVCGFVTYWVMTRAMTRLMESESISRSEFEAIAFHNVSFTTLSIHLRSAVRRKPLRSTLLTMWLVLSCAFVLSVPTWLAAMTGYTVQVDPYFATSENNLVKAKDLNVVLYIIHDGSRLGAGYNDDYVVTLPYPHDTLSYPDAYETMFFSSNCTFSNRTLTVIDDGKSPQALLACAVSVYASMYGFLGLNQTNSTFPLRGVELTKPVLNITAHCVANTTENITASGYLSKSYSSMAPTRRAYAGAWVDPRDSNPVHYLDEPFPQIPLHYNQVLYTLDKLIQNGTCNAGSSKVIRYQWGFSALLLVLFLAFLMVWSIGMYATYMDAWMNSRLVVNGRSMGSVRAAVDMYQAISKKLDAVEEDIDLMSDRQLTGAIRGVCFNYWAAREKCPALRTRSERVRVWWRRFNLKMWVWREKIWLALLALFFLLLGLGSKQHRYDCSSSVFWWLEISWIPIVGIVIVLILGSRRKSRWLVFALFLFVAILTQIILFKRIESDRNWFCNYFYKGYFNR